MSRSPLNFDSIKMKPNGPIRVHLVSFVHCQSYILVRVHLDLPKGTHSVPGPHFEDVDGFTVKKKSKLKK